MAEKNEQVSKILVHEDQHIGDTFNPKDIRVLAIDANIVSLKYLVFILQKCEYKVTWTTIAAEALNILRENKDEYHIVITDIKRLDIDGFKLLEIIGLEMDLPVILVSAEDSKSSIMKGIRHGARDYLLKPVRIQEIKNIWQHVVRKRLSDVSDKSSITKEIVEQESMPTKKHKAEEAKEEEEATTNQSNNDSSSGKKPRVTWSSELHCKFVDAIQQLEAQGERVHPKRIREIMNVKGLSRENIASHLQKYRNMLKKHKARLNQQGSNLGIDLSRYGGILPTKNGGFNVGGDPMPKSQQLSSSVVDMKQVFLKPRQQDVFQQNFPSPNVVTHQGLLNHGPGNFSSTLLTMGNFIPLPEFKGLNFSASSSSWKLPNEYMGMSSQILGPESGLTSMSPFLYPAAASFNPPFEMLGHASTEISPTSVLAGQNSPPGKSEGEISVNLYGSENSNFGGQVSHCPDMEQNPLLIELTNSDEAKLFMDEEISEMVKQFNNDGAPRL